MDTLSTDHHTIQTSALRLVLNSRLWQCTLLVLKKSLGSFISHERQTQACPEDLKHLLNILSLFCLFSPFQLWINQLDLRSLGEFSTYSNMMAWYSVEGHSLKGWLFMSMVPKLLQIMFWVHDLGHKNIHCLTTQTLYCLPWQLYAQTTKSTSNFVTNWDPKYFQSLLHLL